MSAHFILSPRGFFFTRKHSNSNPNNYITTLNFDCNLIMRKKLSLIPLEIGQSLELPLVSEIKAGFPSPAEDFQDQSIDLNKEFVPNPSSAKEK